MTIVSVVFDFDGTIALGRGPLDAYARCVGELAGSAVAEACVEAVRQFNTGTSAHLDAYAAVRSAAMEHGVGDALLSRAYLRSRELLATDEAPIRPPAGLEPFMTELSGIARCVVATNAPLIGLDRALEVLGIAGLVTEVHAAVGKPAGLDAIIAALLTSGPTLAIGDIWDNDLAPAQRLGADTAFVGVGRVLGQPTMRGANLTDLYDDILGWATRKVGAAPVTSVHRTTVER
jgi:phosphoglycolate phosphatase-like HAD superfamily hydrolase